MCHVKYVVQFRCREILFLEPVQQLSQRHRDDFVIARIDSSIAKNRLVVQASIHIDEIGDRSLVSPEKIIRAGQQAGAIKIWISIFCRHVSRQATGE